MNERGKTTEWNILGGAREREKQMSRANNIEIEVQIKSDNEKDERKADREKVRQSGTQREK